ncbi:hypothetical protein RYZ27_09865 [Hyphomonas sp. FCG-A18]|uniref:hypothetical protein n=1 Tax=Hyphomonas sp. FCG-A18 TaxID=3080019 RepID=UPI002B321F9E|nr:hypothetical protein RYZ27_09865 [Hyphomonas sp. FCG-A18]
MEEFLPYILNGAGGAVIGPIISKLLGGKGGTGLLAGIVGGLAGGWGMGEAGVGFQSLLGNDALMNHISNFLNGGVGGGIIGGLLGVLTRAK